VTDILISVESYLGDRVGRLRQALKDLSNKLEIKKISSVYELNGYMDVTKSVLRQSQSQNHWAGGLSLALDARVNLPPEELLVFFQNIEKQTTGATRCVDIDLLFYDDLVTLGPRLTLPHPELHRRPQVVIPASEIWPSQVHPILNKTLSELSMRFKNEKWGSYYLAGKSLLDF